MYKHFEKDPKGEEKKLTDDEIVKAYKSCFIDRADCDTCPCDDWGCGVDGSDILNLINRQKQIIGEYKRKLENGDLVSKEWHDEQIGHAELVIDEQKAEIERLTEERNKYKDLYETMYRKFSDLQDKEFNFEALRKEKTEYFDKAVELQKQVEAWKARAKELEQAWEISSSNEEKLQKQVDELNLELLRYKGLKIEIEKASYEQGQFDTAKEIRDLLRECGEIKALALVNGGKLYPIYKAITDKIDEIVKSKGVEVE